MATKFVQAKNKQLNYTSLLHDDDAPLELFKEVDALNKEHGLTMKDWEFTRHNYKGDKTGTYDWKNAHVTVTLGDLFA